MGLTMWLRRAEYGALLAKIGDLKAEAARWQGAYETQAEAVARLRDDVRRLTGEAAHAREGAERADPWADDPAELERIRAAMAADPVGTLMTEGAGRTA